jgi:hypothetical protein
VNKLDIIEKTLLVKGLAICMAAGTFAWACKVNGIDHTILLAGQGAILFVGMYLVLIRPISKNAKPEKEIKEKLGIRVMRKLILKPRYAVAGSAIMLVLLLLILIEWHNTKLGIYDYILVSPMAFFCLLFAFNLTFSFGKSYSELPNTSKWHLTWVAAVFSCNLIMLIISALAMVLLPLLKIMGGSLALPSGFSFQYWGGGFFIYIIFFVLLLDLGITAQKVNEGGA